MENVKPTASAANFPGQSDYPNYAAFSEAVSLWEREHVHLSSDDYPVVPGAKFWDNNLRVVEIKASDRTYPTSRTYADTGEISTWHDQVEGGSSDTLTGDMRPYGRLTRFYPHNSGKDATNYPLGTDYNTL